MISRPELAECEPDKAVAIPPLGPFYLTLAITSMANTILATALPTVSAELSGAQEYAAVITAYLLPKALTTPVAGRLVDTFAPKKVVYGFFWLYLLTTLGCGLVTSMEQLLVWRVFQGVGGGGLLASIYVMIDLIVPPRSQGRVQATIAGVLGAGAAAAPLVGGLLTEVLGWRWCFFVNIPIIVYCMLATTRLPSLRASGQSVFDWWGSTLLCLVSCPMLLALTWGGSTYPWTSPPILALLTFSAFTAPIFWRLERRAKEPLFDPEMARAPVLKWSFLACFCVGGAFLGSMLYLPLFMTVVKGFSAGAAGMAMLPFILGSIAGAIFGGVRVERTGRYRGNAVGGCLGAALISGALYWQLDGDFSDPAFYLWQFFLAFAFGASQDMYSIAVQNATPASRQGMCGSALEFVRQLGSALGLALVGGIFLIALNKEMPKQMRRWIAPLGVRIEATRLMDPDRLDEVQNVILKAILQRAKQAREGDEHAFKELLHTPILSPQLRQELDPEQRLPYDLKVEGELKLAALVCDRHLLHALATAVQHAQRQVYLLTALLCILATLASLKIPDLPLKDALLKELSDPTGEQQEGEDA